jgi:hypothetical protein
MEKSASPTDHFLSGRFSCLVLAVFRHIIVRRSLHVTVVEGRRKGIWIRRVRVGTSIRVRGGTSIRVQMVKRNRNRDGDWDRDDSPSSPSRKKHGHGLFGRDRLKLWLIPFIRLIRLHRLESHSSLSDVGFSLAVYEANTQEERCPAGNGRVNLI